KWSQTPNAPLLIIAREALARESGAGQPLLPPSQYDQIIESSPNIMYGAVFHSSDAAGVVREYELWTCVSGPGGLQALPSVVLAAEQGVRTTPQRAKQEIAGLSRRQAQTCAQHPHVDPPRERILYHLDFNPSDGRAAPPLVLPEWSDAT